MAYATFARAALLGHRIKLRDGGLQMRTPTYIDDCVEGIVAVASRGKAPGVYNIAGPHSVQLTEVPTLLGELLRRSVSVSIEPRVAGDPRATTISVRLHSASSATAP